MVASRRAFSVARGRLGWTRADRPLYRVRRGADAGEDSTAAALASELRLAATPLLPPPATPTALQDSDAAAAMAADGAASSGGAAGPRRVEEGGQAAAKRVTWGQLPPPFLPSVGAEAGAAIGRAVDGQRQQKQGEQSGHDGGAQATAEQAAFGSPLPSAQHAQHAHGGAAGVAASEPSAVFEGGGRGAFGSAPELGGRGGGGGGSNAAMGSTVCVSALSEVSVGPGGAATSMAEGVAVVWQREGAPAGKTAEERGGMAVDGLGLALGAAGAADAQGGPRRVDVASHPLLRSTLSMQVSPGLGLCAAGEPRRKSHGLAVRRSVVLRVPVRATRR